MSQVLEQPETTISATDFFFFAGDNVRLAAQIDFPNNPMPDNGYPLLCILPHATCTSRNGYSHYARLGTEIGMAVFRWDKRGTGSSGSGAGDSSQDALKAYQAALEHVKIDPQRVVIMALSEASLLLSENWSRFKSIQNPLGTVLVGNMLDEEEIINIESPIQVIMSKNDWNAWQIYAENATQAHSKKYPHYQQSFYVAPNTNRSLMYTNGGAFHRGANDNIKKWLMKICQL
jgi:uncharacterized protein